jgi:hypothetical protein
MQDWANAKAAYRFFGNDRVSEANILAGHFASTRERFVAASGSPVLILHDTTEFSYRHEDSASIGILNKIPTGNKGRSGLHTNCGILRHSSLVMSREGLPVGLAAIKFWNRDKFHGANALKRRINPTRVPIEKKGRKHSLVGESASSHRVAGRSEALCSHRGSGERHI